MNPALRSVVFLILFCAPVFILPAASADVTFSAAEIEQHRRNLALIAKTAAQCLDETYQDHLDFFHTYGVSKFYGNRKAEYKTRDGRAAALKLYGAPASLIDRLEPMSCIGLTLKCLGEGFHAAGMDSTWQKVYQALAADNTFYGTDLQKYLRQLGWKIYYWNPQPADNAAWDAEDRTLNPLKPGKTWNPVWGGHEARYQTVLKKRNYFGIPVDNAERLVGFDTRLPPSFAQVPFFVGTAHAGYHVFPGRNGEVIEAHSTRALNSIDNLQFSVFNPLAPGGGPRWTSSEHYRSGVIAVPEAF